MANKIKQIEEKYKKPLADIMIDRYEALGTIEALANEFGVAKSVVSYHAAREGLEFKTVLVRRGVGQGVVS